MFKKIFIGLLFIIAGLIVVIATRPAEFRYSRSLTIAAPPQLLFEHANDLRKFQDWNPWSKVDPAAVITYAGPPSGVGAAYSWAGNKDVGEGTMTITESKPGERVTARMDFRKPFAAVNTVEFTFKPEGTGTVVTWSMHGPNTFMGKAIGLVADMDKMIGTQFEAGLASLKAIAEKAPQ